MTKTLDTGTTIDQRYEIRSRLLHAPGYIEYRAFDSEVDVDVALWQICLELFPEDKMREQLLLNAHGLRSLVHPHLRRIFGAGEANGILYITWQLATPMTAEDIGDDGQSLVDVIQAFVSGLDEAHNAGYVHGRLTPLDLVQVAGQPKVSGIGLFHGMDPVAANRRWREQRTFVAHEVDAGQLPTSAADVYSVTQIVSHFTGELNTQSFSTLREDNPQLADLLVSASAKAPAARPGTREILNAVTHRQTDRELAQSAPRNAGMSLRDLRREVLFADGGIAELLAGEDVRITDRDLDRPLEAAAPTTEMEEGTTSPTRVLPVGDQHVRGNMDDVDIPTVPGYSRMLNDIGLQPERSDVVLAETQWTNKDVDLSDSLDPTEVDPEPAPEPAADIIMSASNDNTRMIPGLGTTTDSDIPSVAPD